MSLSVSELAALGKLYEEHRPKLLAMLGRRIDPVLAVRIDAEEILQEAFFVAQRRWAQLETSGMTPYAWLYQIVRDSWVEALRRETRVRRDFHHEIAWPEQSSVAMAMSLMGTDTTPSAALARKELQQRIHDLLLQLSPKDREILAMRHFDQLSFGEIAAILEISENTAAQRYVRALQRLRSLWTEQSPPGEVSG
jgi:RNA polymerase sigma-70 factor (ECF subfamily)